MQMKVLGRISVRVEGAGMHGCQVTEPHPCPGKHGLYFQKKTRLGVPSIASRLLKVIETCVYDLRHEKGAHCR